MKVQTLYYRLPAELSCSIHVLNIDISIGLTLVHWRVGFLATHDQSGELLGDNKEKSIQYISEVARAKSSPSGSPSVRSKSAAVSSV